MLNGGGVVLIIFLTLTEIEKISIDNLIYISNALLS